MRKKISGFLSVIALTFCFGVFAHAQADKTTNTKQTIDKKLKILKKPTAQARGCSQTSGLTIIRVTFDKSAKVTVTEIIKSSGCAAFDTSAIDAARRIKFEPQIENGESVTVVRPVEYKYYRY